MGFLLTAMLVSAGMDSYPTLVGLGEYNTFLMFGQCFNHGWC